MNIFFNGSDSISSDSTPENTFIEYRLDITYQEFIELIDISVGLIFTKQLKPTQRIKISEPSDCKILRSVLDDAVETNIWLKDSGEPSHVADSVLPICCNVPLLCKGNLLAYSNLLFALEKSESFLNSSFVISTLRNHLTIFHKAVGSSLEKYEYAQKLA